MSVAAKILALYRQAYPKGRAFRMPVGGDLEKLHNGLIVSEAQAYSDAIAILDSILPDNSNFTEDDATDWERRLGMIYSPLVSLADRKLAILRKMNHPGTIKARQHYLYLEGQLQAAGFDVYVYENRFALYPTGYETRNPLVVSGGLGSYNNQFNDFQFGDTQFGTVYNNIIANYIEEEKDFGFDVGDNLRSTFFIGGSPIGTFANVDLNRKDEFRQLISKIKPAQTVGYLFINYV